MFLIIKYSRITLYFIIHNTYFETYHNLIIYIAKYRGIALKRGNVLLKLDFQMSSSIGWKLVMIWSKLYFILKCLQFTKIFFLPVSSKINIFVGKLVFQTYSSFLCDKKHPFYIKYKWLRFFDVLHIGTYNSKSRTEVKQFKHHPCFP